METKYKKIYQLNNVIFRVKVEETTGAVSSKDWITTDSFADVERILNFFKNKAEYLGYHIFPDVNFIDNGIEIITKQQTGKSIGFNLFGPYGCRLIQFYAYTETEREEFKIEVDVHCISLNDQDWVSKFINSWEYRPTKGKLEKLQKMLNIKQTNFDFEMFLYEFEIILRKNKILNFSHKGQNYTLNLVRTVGKLFNTEINIINKSTNEKCDLIVFLKNKSDKERREFCQSILNAI